MSHVLPQGFSFPFDFGLIRSTLADDGDSLDIIVLMEKPAHIGCLVDIKLVGVVKVIQTEDGEKTQNDRLLGVAVHTFDYIDKSSVEQLPKSLVEQLSEFLARYNKNSGKQDEVRGVEGPEEAIQLLEKAIRKFAG